MSEQIQITLLMGGFTLLGAVITGIAAWLSARFQYARDRTREDLTASRRELLHSLGDVAAFHKLEQRYTLLLSNLARTEGESAKSAEAWKREVRRTVRAEGFATPSNSATDHQARSRIIELEKKSSFEDILYSAVAIVDSGVAEA